MEDNVVFFRVNKCSFLIISELFLISKKCARHFYRKPRNKKQQKQIHGNQKGTVVNCHLCMVGHLKFSWQSLFFETLIKANWFYGKITTNFGITCLIIVLCWGEKFDINRRIFFIVSPPNTVLKILKNMFPLNAIISNWVHLESVVSIVCYQR